ncbi:MAG: tRNA uridine-5-carboxymethylaminomethyl(34) synthesis GTPase MnmE [Candidatus Omnitrophota bacterium]
MKHDFNDTIAAIATAVGESGIGIVRLSGKDALAVADKIFVSKDDKKVPEFKAYTTHYGWIIDKRKPDEPVDEVLLTVMRSPKSFTREDVVEINCHGGIIALRSVLDLVLENGCRLAEPGEFTRRAFLNGRIDLAQAEAVLDIIRAKTDSALRIGAEQLKGRLSKELNRIREELLDILSLVEANIDFPEEDISATEAKNLSSRLASAENSLKRILESSAAGRVMREGISAVICGKPNVGKSSLLNALLKQERSIVTPVAGTTRDTIEEIIDIKGIPVKIVDTAGIIEPRDLVEKKAVVRSKEFIRHADLVIMIFDAGRKIEKQDELLIRKIKGKTSLAVVNKIDLKCRLQKERLAKNFGRVVEISAKKMKNISLLEEAIADLVYKGKVACPEPGLVSNLRHIEAMRKAQKLIAEAANPIDNNALPIELIAQDIKDALGYLDDISGKRFSEELLDKIFSDFCIGK